jgi:hypothetical protein
LELPAEYLDKKIHANGKLALGFQMVPPELYQPMAALKG